MEAASQKLAVLYWSLDEEKIGIRTCPSCSSILLHHSSNLHYRCCKFPAWSGNSYPTSACGYHDQACHPILPQGDSNPSCSASVQLETLLISLCWNLLWLKAAPAVPGQLGTSGHSSCSPQRVWLPEHIFKSCTKLLSFAFCSLSCLSQGTVPWSFPSFSLLGSCGISATGLTGSCAPRAPPAQLSFVAHPIFLTTEGKEFLKAEISPK